MLRTLPLQVALYLTELVDRDGHSVSVIESAPYGIRWGHRLSAVEPPTGNPLVRGGREGCSEEASEQPKQPLSHDMIADISLSLNTTSAC